MLQDSSVLQVIVVDDVCRFALYVWRYLSRCIGFGTGDIPNDGGKFSPFSVRGRLVALETPEGSARVWWVSTERRGWLRHLDFVLKSIGRTDNLCVLLDVRRPTLVGEEDLDGFPEGDLEGAIALMSERGVDSLRDVMLMSSYHTAPRTFSSIDGPLRIFPKSPETLERLWKRIPQHKGAAINERPRSKKSIPSALHILVTGAGFEFKDESYPFSRLGTHPTECLLKRSLSEIFGSKIVRVGKGFHVPVIYSPRASLAIADRAAELRKAAEERDLDRYWNELIALELWSLLNDREGEGGSEVGPDKGRARRREYELRDSFRRQLLRDDWGFLNQALDAFEVPGLVAWLTTNYTRFADRAIELKISNESLQVAKWRVISSSGEADQLMQELLHKRGEILAPSHLFKLHGDLAHLLTMALAGHDKDIFSPLSLPIASLHAIYTVAEQFLKDRLEREAGCFFWHVVGHGLNDALLVRMIRNVCRSTDQRRHGFVIVGPSSKDGAIIKEGATAILKRELDGLKLREGAIATVCLRADQYLSRMKASILPNTLKELERWSRFLEGC